MAVFPKTSLKMYLPYILLCTQAYLVYGQDNVKSSLTFVIDDTGSMSNEISQVLASVNKIFNTVTSSNDSQIENFVLVTFKDPGVTLRTVTQDRNVFKNAVNSISVSGGLGDCWEYSMTGIRLGLENSLPQSLLYVYTDATAKDYSLYKEVESLALKKQIPVTFLLTGDCRHLPHEAVAEDMYYNMAKATSGEVFNVMKNEIKDVIKYIVEKIKGRDSLLVSKKFPPGYGHKVNYTVDGHMKDVLFSITGDKPKAMVTGPNGTTPDTEVLVHKDKVLIAKIRNPTPGMHTAEVGSMSDTSLKVSAKTTINFLPRFSSIKPESFNDTSSKPAPVGNTYLSIALQGDGVNLQFAVIRDLSGKVLQNLTLELVDKDAKFYRTKEFNPPDDKFTVSISGYDEKDNSIITRDATTPLERLDLKYEKSDNISPKVTIDKTPEIIVDYGAPLEVKCRVHGYPQPDIIWHEIETGVDTKGTVSVLDIADNLNILNIDKVTKNSTYECRAKNTIGESSSNIKIGINTYFNIVEATEGQIPTKYNDEARIICKVDAQPPATITWQKSGSPLSADTNIEISDDNTTVIIKHVIIETQGVYVCEAKNELKYNQFSANVTATGLKAPTIMKADAEVNILRGTEGQLKCKIIDGVPPPTRKWVFQKHGGITFENLNETGEILYLNNATYEDSGVYKCIASNWVGNDAYALTMILNYPPDIKEEHDKSKQVKYGDTVTIPCDVSGVPKPTVSWKKDGTELVNTTNVYESSSNSLRIENATLAIIGTYTCQASNKHGSNKKEVNVDVYAVPVVTIENSLKMINYDASLQLECKVFGYPQPEIVWQEKETEIISAATITTKDAPIYTGVLNIDKVKKNATYECKASNSYGKDISSVEVQVKTFFNVIERPMRRIYKNYDEEARIVCEMYALPKATVTWYKDDILLSDDTNIHISDNMTTVTIKHVTIESQGKYTCEAKNELQMKRFDSNVKATGLCAPKIDESVEEIQVLVGNDAEIMCRIVEGVPPPTRQWFFQRKGDSKYAKINETGEILKLKKASDKDIGVYKCEVSNLKGTERYAVNLALNYRPTIKDTNITFILVKNRDTLMITCDVDGVPKPTVTWRKNGTDLVLKSTHSKKIYVTTENSFKILGTTIDDIGVYTCEAKNIHGSDTKAVNVLVHVPVTINTPRVSTYLKLVGDNLLLPCDADGYPKPKIEWKHMDFKGTASKKVVSDTSFLGLIRMQSNDEGYYMCTASNTYTSINITYKVEVNAPPIIENTTPSKTFKAIKGDLVLYIPCKATGRPEPTIVWKRNKLNIASGTDWYDIDNGNLIIKNIDESSKGEYLCYAENKMGSDSMMFNVVIDDYPVHDSIVKNILIERDKPRKLTCDIPHKPVDLLRWYKNNVFIKNGELTLDPVSTSDEGIYTCRVSNMTMSLSEHFSISVGNKPKFSDDVLTVIDFVRGDTVYLPCEAESEPEPEVTWKFNNEIIDVKDMVYELFMEYDKIGEYTCEVKNDLGNITRTFTFKVEECVLDIEKDFASSNLPLMLTPSLELLSWNKIGNYLILNKGEQLYLFCPKGFNIFPGTYMPVFCVYENNVRVRGAIHEFSEIKCVEETKLTIQRSNTTCLYGAEYYNIGYTVIDDQFVELYKVCFDNRNNVPLYAKHQLSAFQYNVPKKFDNWSSHSLMPLDFDTMYNCDNQIYDISRRLGRPFPSRDVCCFGRRQLVNPKDLNPGVPTAAAYTYLNVIPHWSTCNSKNWAKVEESVRVLATSVRDNLEISTGTAESLRMGSYSYVSLYDGRGGNQPVAEYLWKVVIHQEPGRDIRGLAIVQVNVPNLTISEAPLHVLCEDICREINWLRGPNWHNVNNGYTYCCDVQEFEYKFNFRSQFSHGRRINIFKDVFDS